MAKRFTDTEIWDKEWFMKLPCRLKCLVKMVRDKADLSGVWYPNWTIANTYVGEKVTEKDLLSIDGGKQFIKLDNGRIFCLGFVLFQYGELSEKSPVHRKVLNMLKAHNIIDYKHPIYRVEEKEEEEDKEKEEEEDKNNKAPEIEFETLEEFPFDEFWDMYQKKVGRSDCEKKFLKLSRGEKQLIWEHVPKYVESTPNKKFRKDPETYLNGRHWYDEIVIEAPRVLGKMEDQAIQSKLADEYFDKRNAMANE